MEEKFDKSISDMKKSFDKPCTNIDIQMNEFRSEIRQQTEESKGRVGKFYVNTERKIDQVTDNKIDSVDEGKTCLLYTSRCV